MAKLTQYNIPNLVGRSVWDDVFTSLFDEPTNLVRRSTEGYPVTDLYCDKEGNSVIECALAGFKKDQLSVEAKDGRITIQADSGGSEENERRIARRSFPRTFVDHSGKLDLGNAAASFEDGLLRVTVPPVPEEKATSISIG